MRKSLNEDGAVNFRFVLVLVIAFFFVIFILQNLTAVEIQFLIWKATISRVFLLLGSLSAGAVIGFLIGWEAFGKKRTHGQG